MSTLCQGTVARLNVQGSLSCGVTCSGGSLGMLCLKQVLVPRLPTSSLSEVFSARLAYSMPGLGNDSDASVEEGMWALIHI